MTTIDIHDPVFEICDRLSLDPSDVREIRIHPVKAAVTVYRRDADGNFYLEDGAPAMETVEFEVWT